MHYIICLVLILYIWLVLKLVYDLCAGSWSIAVYIHWIWRRVRSADMKLVIYLLSHTIRSWLWRKWALTCVSCIIAWFLKEVIRKRLTSLFIRVIRKSDYTSQMWYDFPKIKMIIFYHDMTLNTNINYFIYIHLLNLTGLTFFSKFIFHVVFRVIRDWINCCAIWIITINKLF